MMKILVTGSSGFIGMHLCKSLLEDGFIVCGIDNMNNYYDPALKKKRLAVLQNYKNYSFYEIDISNYKNLSKVFSTFIPDRVVNLAAQAGVRYSLKNPHEYIKTNIQGFMNILECCRNLDVDGLIYASSSSVYGGNKKTPFSVEDNVDKPISIYAASKKSNELMAYSYSHLYGLNTTGLRFFTVYGPWGRPDMAMYIFLKNIFNNTPIPIFNHGKMNRDFTYIDDIVNGVRSSIDKNYRCEIFNLGNNRSEKLMDMVSIIEKNLGRKAKIVYKGMQPGDVKKTYADISHTTKMLDYNPMTNLDVGIPKFINWYLEYINLSNA